MLVTMKKQVFESLDYSVLSQASIDPTIQQMHSGKGSAFKYQLYGELTRGQRALLMFRVLYDHSSRDLAEFSSWIPHLLESEPNYWSEIKVGMRYFGDDNMLAFLDEVEKVFLPLGEKNRVEADSELHASIKKLHAMINELAPATIERIGHYIQNNLGEFVQIED